MLLESSLLIINIFNKNIYLLISMLIFLLIFNFYIDIEFLYKIKKMDKFILIYLFYLIVSIFLYKTGKIIYNLGNIYITYEGVLKSTINFLRLINFLLISFMISFKFKNKKIRFSSKDSKIKKIENYYSEIFEHILKAIPFIFDLIKKKVKFSHSYKRILLKVYRNL